jgi:hypothetical protein
VVAAVVFTMTVIAVVVFTVTVITANYLDMAGKKINGEGTCSIAVYLWHLVLGPGMGWS